VADGSSIKWTQATWNPTTGCDKVSARCDNCYALTLAKRLRHGADKYQRDGDPGVVE
jgi:protein gp37